MNEIYHTIRALLVAAEQNFGVQDAFRYKVKDSGDGGKKEVKVEAKTYTQFKNDTECFSAVLAAIGEQGKHIAVIGPNSYSWVVAYFGIVDSGSVAVPLDANLPDEDLCELINRADVTTLVYDETKSGVAQMAEKCCEGLKHIICTGEPQGVSSGLSMWKLIGEKSAGFYYKTKPEEH